MTKKSPKGVLIPESSWGVCVWEIAGQGNYLADDEQRYLSMEGILGDLRIEEKMRRAAHYWLGEAKGRPVWIAGHRKVSDAEYEEQMERLIDGKIPDPVDQVRQALRRKK